MTHPRSGAAPPARVRAAACFVALGLVAVLFAADARAARCPGRFRRYVPVCPTPVIVCPEPPAALVPPPPAEKPADKPADQPGAEAPKGPARSLAPKGALWHREAPGKPWQLILPGEGVPAGQPILGAPGSPMLTRDGAIRLTLGGDLDGTSPFPVVEPVVLFHDNPEVDLDFTLDRGRVDVQNQKKEGAAQVRMHVRDQVFDLTLAEPGTDVAFELYSRWPAGTRFKPRPDPKHVPVVNVIILVLKGRATLRHADHEYALSAPPGPAIIEWDNMHGLDDSPHRLEKLPAWASQKAPDTEAGKARLASRQRLLKLLASKPYPEVTDELLRSANPADRRLAVYLMAAMDELEHLAAALAAAKYPDLWDHAVPALRHWLGRGPGQDQRLFQALVEKGKMSRSEAQTILQLILGFDDKALTQPELYETLIDYLDHDRLAIRGLAYWNLSHVVPAGRKFGYNPLDPKGKRDKAVQAWRQFIPAGKLPPGDRPNGNK